MNEPLNSWEVSYVILMNRPNKQLGTSFKELVTKISKERRQKLMQWSSEFMPKRWIADHV